MAGDAVTRKAPASTFRGKPHPQGTSSVPGARIPRGAAPAEVRRFAGNTGLMAQNRRRSLIHRRYSSLSPRKFSRGGVARMSPEAPPNDVSGVLRVRDVACSLTRGGCGRRDPAPDRGGCRRGGRRGWGWGWKGLKSGDDWVEGAGGPPLSSERIVEEAHEGIVCGRRSSSCVAAVRDGEQRDA